MNETLSTFFEFLQKEPNLSPEFKEILSPDE